jgi:hypothetical protein
MCHYDYCGFVLYNAIVHATLTRPNGRFIIILSKDGLFSCNITRI